MPPSWTLGVEVSVKVLLSGEVLLSSRIVPWPCASLTTTPLLMLVRLIRKVSGFSRYTSSVIGTLIVTCVLPAGIVALPLTAV